MSIKESGSPSRRDFIKTAGLGAGIAAVTSGVLSASAAEASPLVSTEEKLGYRETEHVKKYYESAQF